MDILDRTLLEGRWINREGGVVRDEACDAIERLIGEVLVHIADHPSEGGWRSLYRDPRDGRWWERYYPSGNLHGGGPPSLRRLSRMDAVEEYGRIE